MELSVPATLSCGMRWVLTMELMLHTRMVCIQKVGSNWNTTSWGMQPLRAALATFGSNVSDHPTAWSVRHWRPQSAGACGCMRCRFPATIQQPVKLRTETCTTCQISERGFNPQMHTTTPFMQCCGKRAQVERWVFVDGLTGWTRRRTIKVLFQLLQLLSSRVFGDEG